MGDTILYTPPNRPDTFPSSYVLDVATGDGDEFTCLMYSNGQLLAFKTNSLYIIDVSNPNDSAWRLLNRFDGLGIKGPWAATSIKGAIAFANESGLHMYAGNNMNNLISGKYSISDWADFLTTPMVGYDSSSGKIIVTDNAELVTKMRIYDMATKSWTSAGDFNRFFDVAYQDGANEWANLITFKGSDLTDFNPDGGILAYISESSISDSSVKDLQELSFRDTGASKFYIHTRDEDFGMPMREKKIYAVTLTYITDNTGGNIDIKYDINGNDTLDTSSSALITEQAITGVAGFDNTQTLRIPFTSFVDTSGAPIKCKSIAFRIQNYNYTSGASIKLKILSIGIEYRVIRQFITSETVAASASD